MPMAGIELAKAYVQVIPSAKGIKEKLKEEMEGPSREEGEKSGTAIGTGLVGKLKGILAAAGIAAAVKTALDAGGALQQSFGGLDTIYESAAGKAKEYAAQAAAAGISSNTYAEQAVSFGVALKSSLGGDAVAAAEAANKAILDMADNSAKMGTDIGDIQNAYQGFAKGNYTMLDNLKLGYGGTKQGMQQLLDKANELNAAQGKNTNYSIESFADIVDAIHTVQDNLGIAGVAAEEAKTTLSGSLTAIKASFENVLAGLTLGQDIKPALAQLATSISDFVVGNLLPMVMNLIGGLLPAIVVFMQTMYPQLIAELLNGVTQITTALQTQFPAFLQSGVDMINNMINGFLQGLPEAITGGGEIVTGLLDSILDAIPQLLDAGVQLIQNLANGFQRNGPAIYEAVAQALTNIINTIGQHLPGILSKGVELIGAMASGILQNLPTVLSGMATVLTAVVAAIASNLPTILAKGIELIGKLAAGIIQGLPTVAATVPKIFSEIVSKFASHDWGSIGSDLIKGIAKGITGAAGQIVEAAKDAAKKAFEGAKNFLGIQSPSRLFRDEVGRYMALGMAEGMTENASAVTGAVEGLSTGAYDLASNRAMSFRPGSQTTNRAGATININVYGAKGQDEEELADEVHERLTRTFIRKEAVFA